MFKILKKTTYPLNMGVSQEYPFAMKFVRSAVEEEKNDQDKIVILEFLLNIIKEDLRTDLLSRIIYSQEQQVEQFKYPFPLVYDDENGNEQSLEAEGIIEIDLAKDTVLVVPQDQKKLRVQIKNIFYHNFSYDRINHCAYYFPCIGLCYVYNGKHSVSSGIIHKKGIIKAEIYDLTKIFPHINNDGRYWYNRHSDERIGELADFRVGIIYEIAKIKHTLEKA